MPDVDRTFECEVLEVHSGDDLLVLVDLGVDNLFKRIRIRLKGVDTPDAFRSRKDTVAGKVRDEISRIVNKQKCIVVLHRETKGGWVVTLYLADAFPSYSINDLLINEGYVFEDKSNGNT